MTHANSTFKPVPAKSGNATRVPRDSVDKLVRRAVETSARFIAKAALRRVTVSLADADVASFERELAEKLAGSLTRTTAILLAGKEVRVSEDDPLLTTQQAADLLGVSRPHLVKLLDSAAIQAAPRAGNQRRVHRSAIARYRRTNAKAREKALSKLSALAQKHGMGY